MRNRNSRSDLFEERAVVALMEHLDPPPAASALGVSLRTLTRCMDKPAFQAARLRAAERAHTLQQRIRLAQGLGPVVQSAATILLTAKTRPARLQAARLIETIVRAADEIEDFGAEVAQVQRQADPGGKPGDRNRRTAAPGITRDPVVAQTTTGDHRTAAPAQCRRSRPRGRDQHRHALSVARGTGIRGRPDGGRERPSGPR